MSSQLRAPTRSDRTALTALAPPEAVTRGVPRGRGPCTVTLPLREPPRMVPASPLLQDSPAPGVAEEETEAGPATPVPRAEGGHHVPGTGWGARDTSEPQRAHFPPVLWHLAPDWTLRDSGLSGRDPKTTWALHACSRHPKAGRHPSCTRCNVGAGRLLGVQPVCSSGTSSGELRPPFHAFVHPHFVKSSLTALRAVGGAGFLMSVRVRLPVSMATPGSPVPGH